MSNTRTRPWSRRRRIGATAAVTSILAIAASTALAVTPVNIDQTTQVSVDSINLHPSPTGLVYPQTHSITVDGQVSIGGASAAADTGLITTVDLSWSTTHEGGETTCGEANDDGVANTVLDCELAAAKSLNTEAASSGVVASTGAAAFGTVGSTVDVGPASGTQLATTAAADGNANGVADMAEVFGTMQVGHIGQFTTADFASDTNFADGLAKTKTVLAASGHTKNIVVFLSDGHATVGGSISGPLAGWPANAPVDTFAVGPASTCANPGDHGEGSLQQIADATGGTCTHVDASDLPSVLPLIVASSLNAVSLKTDTTSRAITTGTALPTPGPASTSYSTVGPITGLSVGSHQVCVFADGSVGAKTGQASDCRTITINAAPTVNPGGGSGGSGYAGPEGTAIGINGSFADSDGPVDNVTWTFTPAPGFDPGATCTIADPHALVTTITCTDDGHGTLKLTVDDTVNPPVSAQVPLSVSNADPKITGSTPPSTGTTTTPGQSLPVTVSFTDPGTNDTHTCTFDWGEGSPTTTGATESGGAGSCSSSHTYNGGDHTIVVTVRDDDGGMTTVTIPVHSTAKVEAYGIAATGLVFIGRTPDAKCPAGPSNPPSVLFLPVAPLLVSGTLNASCGPVGTSLNGEASTEQLDLLGAIHLTGVKSTCASTTSGPVGSSSVATLNGMTIGSAPITIKVPTSGGVISVSLNEHIVGPNGKLTQNAVHVKVLQLLSFLPPLQDIVVSGCEVG